MEGLNLTDLFKWKKRVDIINSTGKPIGSVWVRVLGDFDIQEAYKFSRLASNKKRAALRDPQSLEYQDEVLPIAEFSREDKYEIIRSANQTLFINEAASAIERPELPKMSEVAVNPDAPTLEEQEEFDKLVTAQDQAYTEEIQKYVDNKVEVLQKLLEEMSDEDLTKEAQIQISTVTPFSTFMDELNVQKILRGTYKDEKCTEHAFESREDVLNAHTLIKQQLLRAFSELEIDPDKIKNS